MPRPLGSGCTGAEPAGAVATWVSTSTSEARCSSQRSCGLLERPINHHRVQGGFPRSDAGLCRHQTVNARPRCRLPGRPSGRTGLQQRILHRPLLRRPASRRRRTPPFLQAPCVVLLDHRIMSQRGRGCSAFPHWRYTCTGTHHQQRLLSTLRQVYNAFHACVAGRFWAILEAGCALTGGGIGVPVSSWRLEFP